MRTHSQEEGATLATSLHAFFKSCSSPERISRPGMAHHCAMWRWAS